jgi:hypothetical protein
MNRYYPRFVKFEVRSRMSNKDWKCKTCKCKIPKDERRIVVDYQSPDGLFMSDSHCLSCGQKKLIKFPGEEFFDKARFETKSVIDKLLGENPVSGINCGSIDESSNELTKVTLNQLEGIKMAEDKLTFKPDFCFLDLDDHARLPLFDPQDTPTKVIKTPSGFHVYFEDKKFDLKEQQRLAKHYGGDPTARRIYKEGSTREINGDDFTYEEYQKPEFEDDHRKSNPKLHMLYVKWACKHLTIIDGCIKKMNRESNCNMHDPIEALRNARAKLIKENAAYFDAHEVMNEIRIGKEKKKLSTDGYQVEACSSAEELEA